jgi:integrase
MKGLFLRNGIWWYKKVYRGRKATGSLGTNNKRLAEDTYSKTVLPGILDGSYWIEQARPITFGELVRRYLGVSKGSRDYCTSKRVLAYFGNMLATEIDIDDVEDYINFRLGQEAAHATVYLEFAFCRAMYNVARKRWRKEYGIILNPFADAGFPGYDNTRTRFADIEEEKALIDSASPEWLKDIITFAIHTGCRRGEILKALWKTNVDMQRREVRIQASKGGNFKVIPMSETLYAMLKRRHKVSAINTLVFPHSLAAVKDAWERCVVKSKVPDFHFHDLRHTFGSRLAQAGVDILRIKELMGHKSIKMPMRYTHLNTENLRPAIAALDNCYNTATMEKEEIATEAANGLI